MKKIYLFLFIILVSCNSNINLNNDDLTANQKFIKNCFDKSLYYSKIYPDSLSYLAKILEKKALNENENFQAMTAYFKAIDFKKNSSFELSLKQYEKMFLLLKTSKNDTLKAYAFSGKGSYYNYIGDYPKAFENYFKALKIFELNKMTEKVGFTNSNIGEVYMKKDDLITAKKYLISATINLESKKNKI